MAIPIEKIALQAKGNSGVYVFLAIVNKHCFLWVKTEFFNHAFQTNGQNEVQYFNYLYEAKDVVATGLKDLYRTRKDYSVHGLPIKAQVALVKCLPHSLVMTIWQNQQKHPKNNQGLTTK